MQSLKDFNLKGKKVLLRADYNVPLSSDLKVKDLTRLIATLPTLTYLIDQGASIILISHLGRPEGKFDPRNSLKPIAFELSKLLGKEVKFVAQTIGREVREIVNALKPGEVLLLENLRFYEGEERPDKEPSFAKGLADLADVYVNDAFACSHRAHASIVEVPKYFSQKAPGFLLEKEVKNLVKLIKDPKRPFLALIGGAKISTKIGILEALTKQANVLAVGGAMAFTFLKAKGIAIGKSFFEEKYLKKAKTIIERCLENKVVLHLPLDVIAMNEGDARIQIISLKESGIPENLAAYDIGPQTINLFSSDINAAGTILWNGPLGVFEKKPFENGTKQIIEALMHSDAVTIVGGGETLEALQLIPSSKDSISHLSTGGGATLEYIELQGNLPGIKILENN